MTLSAPGLYLQQLSSMRLTALTERTLGSWTTRFTRTSWSPHLMSSMCTGPCETALTPSRARTEKERYSIHWKARLLACSSFRVSAWQRLLRRERPSTMCFSALVAFSTLSSSFQWYLSGTVSTLLWRPTSCARFTPSIPKAQKAMMDRPRESQLWLTK